MLRRPRDLRADAFAVTRYPVHATGGRAIPTYPHRRADASQRVLDARTACDSGRHDIPVANHAPRSKWTRHARTARFAPVCPNQFSDASTCQLDTRRPVSSVPASNGLGHASLLPHGNSPPRQSRYWRPRQYHLVRVPLPGLLTIPSIPGQWRNRLITLLLCKSFKSQGGRILEMTCNRVAGAARVYFARALNLKVGRFWTRLTRTTHLTTPYPTGKP